MSRLSEIKERWKYFLDDTWAHADRRDKVTGQGVVTFAPVMKDILLVIKRDATDSGAAIIVAAVAETAPLVCEALVHAPQDIRYLLDLLEESGYGQDEIVQDEHG